MAFVPKRSVEKKETDYYDESNCIKQSIVHNDGDHRQPITESRYNKEDIIACIGQLEANYKYDEKCYERRMLGTGTVFKTQSNKCFVLTAAHIIRMRIMECPKCLKYMGCGYVKCIRCNCDRLKYKLIPATKIIFRRREIRHHVLLEKNDGETTGYKFGDIRKSYLCKCEFVDDVNYNSFDYSILSFINNDNYGYTKCTQHITIKNEVNALKKKTIPTFNIYGYSIERDKRNKMYGMESTNSNYSVGISRHSNQYFLKQREIDTLCGQQGAAVWYKRNNAVIIFAIHSGGSNMWKGHRFNVAQIINDNILLNIENITNYISNFFKYKRAQQILFNDVNDLNLQIHNIGIVMSDFGDWTHQTTGFIFAHSSLSAELYVLTEAQAVISWNSKTKEFEQADNVSFHLRKNVNVNNSEYISNYSAVSWGVHPKYIQHKLKYYNIAIIKIIDPKNELWNVKPLQLCASTKNYDSYNRAKVFGFAGVWNEELFGMKGAVNCLDGKIIRYENIVCRGRGGPVFCYDEKQEQNMSDEFTKALKLLNFGLDADSVINELNNQKIEKKKWTFFSRKSSNVQDIYNKIYKEGAYRPSSIDQWLYNAVDADYCDIFNCFGDEVMGISLGEEGLLFDEELLDWIQSYMLSQEKMYNEIDDLLQNMKSKINNVDDIEDID